MVAALVEVLGDTYKMVDIVESFDILLPQEQIFFAYGAFDGEKLVGSIAVIKQGHLYNRDDVIAHEAYWYVYPSYRGVVGSRLLEVVEKECSSCKIDFGISDPLLQKLMQRRGYRPIKTIMRKDFGHV